MTALLESPNVRRVVMNTFASMKRYDVKWGEDALRDFVSMRGASLTNHYVYGSLEFDEMDALLDLVFFGEVRA